MSSVYILEIHCCIVKSTNLSTIGIIGHHMTHICLITEHSYGRGSLGLIPTHPINFPCGRKPEYPEKTHDFRQSVD
jgi:hypothetical protein